MLKTIWFRGLPIPEKVKASEPGRGDLPQPGVYREAGWNASPGAERGLDDRKEVHETRLIR
mgnify:CR=1 FL=1